MPQELHEYLAVFLEEAASRFPERKPWDHKILLKKDFKPRKGKIYDLSPEEDILLQEFIQENSKKGTKKKRPCQDYQLLNEGTIKDAYPLPRISSLINKLQGKTYFTKMDVQWGYNNIQIANEDQWKAAFITKYGLFEPTIMFFGLTNSPATFQWMVDNIFVKQLAKGWLIIYMDDMLFATGLDQEKHFTCVHECLQIL